MGSITGDTDVFVEHQAMLRRLAYKMLGSVSQADDAVQEAWIRWQATAKEDIVSPRAWLVTVTSRICIDFLRIAKQERAFYGSPWLPEPLMTEEIDDPHSVVERYSGLSMGFLLMLERLSPHERVAFLLQEVFEEDYQAIAFTLNRSEAACRQLVHRARRKVRGEDQGIPVEASRRQEFLLKFAQALHDNDLSQLLTALAPDVVLISDGGGKVKAASRPVHGQRAVSRLLIGVRRLQAEGNYALFQRFNAEVGVAGYTAAGVLSFVMQFDVDQSMGIRHIYVINNPDKLVRFGMPSLLA